MTGKQQQCAFCNEDFLPRPSDNHVVRWNFSSELLNRRRLKIHSKNVRLLKFHNYEKLPDLCSKECVEKYCDIIKKSYDEVKEKYG